MSVLKEDEYRTGRCFQAASTTSDNVSATNSTRLSTGNFVTVSSCFF